MIMIAFVSFEEMKDAGMSPLEIILVLAFIAIIGWVNSRLKKHETDREAWHAETRGQVKELKDQIHILNGHVDVCEKDRIKLTVEGESFKREIETLKIMYRNCTVSDCPIRRKSTASDLLNP